MVAPILRQRGFLRCGYALIRMHPRGLCKFHKACCEKHHKRYAQRLSGVDTGQSRLPNLRRGSSGPVSEKIVGRVGHRVDPSERET
jgi:hypothetical protein